MRALIVVIAATAALGASQASAVVMRVDARGVGDFTTIQAAIDAASEGDTVLVAPGTYTGNGNRDLDFGGTNLTLLSVAGPESTIIDCEGTSENPHRGFHFHNGETSSSIVTGFAVVHGWASTGSGILSTGCSPAFSDMDFAHHQAGDEPWHGAVISCSNSPISLQDVTIDSCACRSGLLCDASSPELVRVAFLELWGAGIECVNGSDPEIRDCLLLGNYGVFNGCGGMQCVDSSPILERVRFEANYGQECGGIACERSSPSLTDVVFVGNSGSVGALDCADNSSPVLTRVRFVGNDGDSGGAVRCVGSSSPQMLDVVFRDNWSSWDDGAMSIWGSSPVLRNVTFVGNLAANTYGAGAVGVYGSSSPLIEYATFVGNGNHGGWAGAMVCLSGATPVVRNATFAANTTGGDDESGMLASRQSAPVVENCILAFGEDGTPGIWCSGPPYPSLAHCCVFGNTGGDSLCGTYHDNIFEDPLFCSLADTNLALHTGSPCLPGGNPWSELIGSQGAGCGTGVPDASEPGLVLAIERVRPNPFWRAVSIDYSAPASDGPLEVVVYNLGGQVVKTLLAAPVAAGPGRLMWDGSDDTGQQVAAGVYFCRAALGSEAVSTKLVVAR